MHDRGSDVILPPIILDDVRRLEAIEDTGFEIVSVSQAIVGEVGPNLNLESGKFWLFEFGLKCRFMC